MPSNPSPNIGSSGHCRIGSGQLHDQPAGPNSSVISSKRKEYRPNELPFRTIKIGSSASSNLNNNPQLSLQLRDRLQEASISEQSESSDNETPRAHYPVIDREVLQRHFYRLDNNNEDRCAGNDQLENNNMLEGYIEIYNESVEEIPRKYQDKPKPIEASLHFSKGNGGHNMAH